MKQNTNAIQNRPEFQHLDALVGCWQGSGITSADGKTRHVHAVDTYEWPEDGGSLLHHWEWRIAGQRDFLGTEKISFDERTHAFSARMEDNAGHSVSYDALVEEGGSLILEGAKQRAQISLTADKQHLAAEWEFWKEGEHWQPLCDMRWERATHAV